MTGCSATYEVEIYNDKVNETISFYYDNTSSKDSAELSFNEYLERFQDTSFLGDRIFKEYYNKKKKLYYVKENTSYKLNDYSNELDKVKLNFKTIDYRNNKEFITLRVLDYAKYFDNYPELNSLKVVIKSNHKLKETNADEVHGHSYIWNIDRINYKDIKPSIILYSDQYVFNYENEFVKKIIYIGGFIGIILVVSMSIYIKVKKKNKSMNEI